MAQRQHLTKDGPKDCNAAPGNCPVENAAKKRGEEVLHFPSKKAANAAWAEMLATEHADTLHTSLKQGSHKKNTTSGLTVEDISDQLPEGVVNNGKIYTGTLVSGRIDPSKLNDESYKEFGFIRRTGDELWREQCAAGLSVSYGYYDYDDYGEYDPNYQITIPDVIPPKEAWEFQDDGYSSYVSTLECKTLDQKGLKTLVEYTENWSYEQINTPLYKNEEPTTFTSKSINILDDNLQKGSFGHQRIVYRGAVNEMVEPETQTYRRPNWDRNVGTIVEFDGFTSSSYSLGKALQFSQWSRGGETKCHLYEILTPEGVSLECVTTHEGEEEVLLPRQQRYVVVGNYETEARNRKGNPIYYHVAQMVAVNENNEILGGNVRSPKPTLIPIEEK